MDKEAVDVEYIGLKGRVSSLNPYSGLQGGIRNELIWRGDTGRWMGDQLMYLS